jgi:acyl carrier protein
MGLDSVELVMEVEEAFGIKISDERACEIRTVGDLYETILDLRRDSLSRKGICLSAATFYRIRRAVCAELGLNPKSVRPRTTLESTITRRHRRPIWARLEAALKLKLPRLARPKWLVVVAVVVSGAMAGWIGLLGYRAWGADGGAATFMVALFASTVVAAWATLPFETRFRPAFTTYGGLSRVVLAHNYATLGTDLESWDATEIWEAMKTVIVEQLEVKPEAVTRDARFVDDFGME